MSDGLEVLLLTLIAGLAIPLGGICAKVSQISNRVIATEFNHFIVAFGGGALLSAVALVLVPVGIESLSIYSVAACFISGGVVFMLLDKYQAQSGGGAPQLTAMLTDFIPEALALGALFAVSKESGLLLAFIIFLQNLPEGYNAFNELSETNKHSDKNILIVFCLLVLLGPAAGALGLFVLVAHSQVLAAIMLFAAGGIIYTTFQDIAPSAALKSHWSPSLGAVFGFSLGLIGHIWVHG